MNGQYKTWAILDEDADEELLRLQTVATHEPSTFTRAKPILPHWACRGDKAYSPWPGNYTYQPGFTIILEDQKPRPPHPYTYEVI